MYEVLVDLPIHIPMKEVYRYMGCSSDRQDISPSIEYMVEEEIAAAVSLILPKATYVTYDYNPQTNCVIPPEGKLKIIGANIQAHLANCTKATLFTCTIGSDIEPFIDTYFKAGEFKRAIILDAIGSAAVEHTTDTLNQYLFAAAYRQKYSLVSRFSPGYADWNLAIQRDLVNAAGGPAIGIQVTSSSLLIPRKSVSGIIGWIAGLEHHQIPHTSPCHVCQMPKCQNPICKGEQII